MVDGGYNVSGQLETGNVSTNLSEPVDYYYYYYYDINIPDSLWTAYRIFATYVNIAIFVLALPNILVLYVLLTKRNRNYSISAYLTALAAADISVVGDQLFAVLQSLDLYMINSLLECQMRTLMTLGVFASPLIQSIISVERAYSVLQPHKTKSVCTVNVARIVIVVIWSIALGITMAEMFMYDYVYEYQTLCVIKPEYGDFYVDYYVWIVLTNLLIFPLGTIALSSTILVYALVARRPLIKSKVQKAATTRITIIVLTLNVLFVVCNTPYFLHYMIYLSIDDIYEKPVDYYYYHAVLSNILLTIMRLNNSVNFYVYFLAGSRFRSETKQVFINIKQLFLRIISQGKKK